jgi:hypothetical protein
MKMNENELERIATIRATVGFLGEKDQAAWWTSSFFASGSPTFLSPIFARTQLVAQCVGVATAASKVHDERIGIGQVYHLFRLPEDLEQGVHRILRQPSVAGRIAINVATRDQAVQYLRSGGRQAQQNAIGPTRIAGITGLRDASMWEVVAATYADGFEKGTECYPYFTDRK